MLPALKCKLLKAPWHEDPWLSLDFSVAITHAIHFSYTNLESPKFISCWTNSSASIFCFFSTSYITPSPILSLSGLKDSAIKIQIKYYLISKPSSDPYLATHLFRFPQYSMHTWIIQNHVLLFFTALLVSFISFMEGRSLEFFLKGILDTRHNA